MMMSLPALIARHRLRIRGVLHVGAHLGEEAETYQQCNVGPVWWVEANPEVLPQLRAKVLPYGHAVIEALVDEVAGRELEFHLTGPYAGSSSILEFGTHPTFSPEVKMVKDLPMKTVTIDQLVEEHAISANLLVMDLQGAELRAIRGAIGFLKQVDVVFSEVNAAEVYKGCAKIWELDDLLYAASRFVRMETYWCGDQQWGDALWVRRSVLER